MSGSFSTWRQAQLESILELSLALGGPKEEAELADELVHRAVGLLDARMGLVLTVGEEGQPNSWRSVNWPGQSLAFWEKWLQLRQSDGVEFYSGKQFSLPCGQVMVAPGLWQGQLMLVLAVAARELRGGEGNFSSEDATFLRSLALLAASTLASSRALAAEKRLRQALEEENRSLREDFADFVAESDAMKQVLALVRRVGPLNVSVLIRGESGTGKERIARLLHQLSPRARGPFVAINCAAVPESLLEAEFFGIEKGVATGVEARIGKLEMASGGTLFLDEVGDLTPNLQGKLLRVLQERKLERVGGRREISVDVRLVSATNRDLEAMLKASQFRPDLYYRLRVVELRLPPLRERPRDIPILIRRFLDYFGKKLGRPTSRFSRGAWELLLAYRFPGNVRELEHLVEASLALASGEEVTREDVLLAMGKPTQSLEPPETLEELVQAHVWRTLERFHGNKKAAARVLGVDRSTLYRMLKRWNATSRSEMQHR